MATDAERARFRKLAGTQLPVGDAAGVAYTDAEADAYLEAQPACPMRSGGGLDVYAAAAAAWLDKAEELEVVAVATESAVLIKGSVKQADASFTLARPVPLGSVKLAANDPQAMRSLARRLQRRSCNGGGFRSADVAPPEVVRPGPRDPFAVDYDGPEWIDRALILKDVENPDGVINLPEPD